MGQDIEDSQPGGRRAATRASSVLGRAHRAGRRRAFWLVLVACLALDVPADPSPPLTAEEIEARLATATGGQRLDFLLQWLAILTAKDEKSEKSLPRAEEALELAQALGLEAQTIEALEVLGKARYDLGDVEGAAQAGERAIELARDLEDPLVLSRVLVTQSRPQETLGNLDLAREHLTEAIELLESEEPGDRRQLQLGQAYGRLGGVHRAAGDRPRALEAQLRAYELVKPSGNRREIARALHNIAMLHDDYAVAVDYFRQAADIHEEDGREKLMALSLVNIGLLQVENDDLGPARENLERVREVGERLGDGRLLAWALLNLGIVEFKSENFESAGDLYEKTLELARSQGLQRLVSVTQISQGQLLHQLGRLEEAAGVLRQALDSGLTLRDEEALLELATVLEKMGRYREALEVFREYDEVKSAAREKDKTFTVANLRASFEFERKAEEIASLEQQRKIDALRLEQLEQERQATKLRLGLLSAGLGLALLGVVLGHTRFRLRLERRRREQAAARQVELEAVVEERTAELVRENERVEAARALISDQAERLRKLDRMKSHLFANLSHELRTPLTLVLGPLDDLRRGTWGELEPAVDQQLALAEDNAGRVLELINQILDLARLEAGRLELRAARGDLRAFLADLAQRFAPLGERRQIDFKLQTGPDPVAVYFDPDLLDKVLTNLLSNAFKLTPKGGSVRLGLSIHPTGGRAVVSVSDTGPGIPDGEIENIFERFYRVENPSLRGVAGSGLGLSLARELVELHRGSLTVESTVGRGSTFRVELRPGREHLRDEEIVDASDTRRPMPELPAAPQPGAPQPPDMTDETVDRLSDEEDRTTVLVVEDHPDVRAFIRRHLQEKYRVLEAMDGDEGLRRAREALPDLVLSDVMMPGMDGYTLVRHLKQDPELDYVPVILLTARAGKEDRLKGLHEGVDDYLTKPFDADELIARVDNLIASRRQMEIRLGSPLPPRSLPKQAVPADRKFLERIYEVIHEEMGSEDFNVDSLASRMATSRVHLYRRLRALVDQTPSELIRSARLETAERLLRSADSSISEIAYRVGFKSVSHFSSSFRQRFKKPPSVYLRSSQA